MEIVEGIEVVRELPAVIIRQARALVIADTHLGFEEEMAKRGVFIPRFQLRRVLNVLEEAIDEVSPELVVIAGDFKHMFSGLGRLERRELLEVITFVLSNVGSLVVVRGNHDNYLPLLQRKLNFDIVDGLTLGRYLIVHGHKPIRDLKGKWEVLIFGHEHPSIRIRDALGTVGRFSCFLTGRLANGKRFVTLPAVGAYQTGSRVTLNRETYLSPILREQVDLNIVKPVIVDEDVGLFELPPLAELLDFI